MISKEKLLKQPNYLLSKYQAEIYRQLSAFMKENKLSQKQVAKKLGVSNSYVNQILKGNFNYTLKKLVEISLLIGKVPSLEFISFNDIWDQQKRKREDSLIVQASATGGENTVYIKVPEFKAVSSKAFATATSDAEDIISDHYWIAQCDN